MDPLFIDHFCHATVETSVIARYGRRPSLVGLFWGLLANCLYCVLCSHEKQSNNRPGKSIMCQGGIPYQTPKCCEHFAPKKSIIQVLCFCVFLLPSYSDLSGWYFGQCWFTCKWGQFYSMWAFSLLLFDAAHFTTHQDLFSNLPKSWMTVEPWWSISCHGNGIAETLFWSITAIFLC